MDFLVGVEIHGVTDVVIDEILLEDLPFIHHQRWREVGISFIEFQREVEEVLLLLFGCYSFYFYHSNLVWGIRPWRMLVL